MTSVTRLCEATSCSIAVQRGKLMCINHWYQAPAETRRLVNRTWRDYRRATREHAPVEERMFALGAYRKAVKAAVDSLSGPCVTEPKPREASDEDDS
jgi:hypothetical protein